MKVTHWLVTKLISIFQQQQQRKQSYLATLVLQYWKRVIVFIMSRNPKKYQEISKMPDFAIFPTSQSVYSHRRERIIPTCSNVG